MHTSSVQTGACNFDGIDFTPVIRQCHVENQLDYVGSECWSLKQKIEQNKVITTMVIRPLDDPT